MIAASTLSPARLDQLRRRTVWSLVASVALGSVGYIAALTVATIVAKDLAGSAAWSGAPGAGVVLGSAVGSTLLSRLMAARGRRAGLTAGYLIGVCGALVSTTAVITRSLPLLLAGMTLIGFGNSAGQLSRYTAADLFGPARRASAIGFVVWSATVGAVVGPNLVGWANDLGSTFGLPAFAGTFLVPVAFVGAAALIAFVRLRPDPYELADTSETIVVSADGATSLERILRRPHVPVAIAALIAGQVVMVLIMTMTPLHMTDHGHSLGDVGLVISAHTFGMFALSPLSGRLTDRFGSPVIVFAGLAVLCLAALVSAVAPADGGPLLLVALFLLGYGWNLGFVAGSALLTHGLGLAERTRLQGLTDALIWGSAAVASLGSGVLIAAAGFTALGILGAAVVVVPAGLLIARRQAMSGAAS
jgi:MFS family permease